MSKIALIGAGSVNFCAELLAGLFRFEALRESNIALHDADAERLQTAEAIARRMAEARESVARFDSRPLSAILRSHEEGAMSALGSAPGLHDS